ncbi:MAG: hypothetical protein QOJ73_345, partial [Streptosporangiaceae bacterium]|nr:hypothetical protein [Streptosporangiaceae bacterium]
LHGKEVTFQACIWHQHPYTAQCSSLYKSLAAHHVNEAANAYRSMWPRRGAVTWESR